MLENWTSIIELSKFFGMPGVYIVISVITVFIILYGVKHYLEIHTSRTFARDNQFNKFFELIEKSKTLSKSNLILEHKFEDAYKLYLSADEIEYVLRNKEPLLFIRNLRNCYWLFEFNPEKEIYSLKTKKRLSLKTKKLINSWFYYICAILMILGFMLIFFSVNRFEKVVFSVLTFEFGFGMFVALRSVKNLNSAIKISSDYFSK